MSLLNIADPELSSLVVSIVEDMVDPFDYEYSLREALDVYRDKSASSQTIQFDSATDGSVIGISGGDIAIVLSSFSQRVALIGNGASNTIISGSESGGRLAISGAGAEVAVSKMTLSGALVTSGGSMQVGSDTVLYDAVADNGLIYASQEDVEFHNTLITGGGGLSLGGSGNIAGDTRVEDGQLTIGSGGVAYDTVIDMSDSAADFNTGMHMYMPGTAYDTTLYNGAIALWTSGGVVDRVTMLGEAGQLFLGSGATAKNVTASAGFITVCTDGVLENAIIHSGASLLGLQQTGSGNGILSGDIQLGGNLARYGVSFDASGADLTLLVNERLTTDGEMISNFDLVIAEDFRSYTINVDAGQLVHGASYFIASLAGDFSATAAITIGGGASIGGVSLAQSLTYNNFQYTLRLDSNDSLYFDIASLWLPEQIVTIAGDLVALQDSDYSLREVVEEYAPLFADDSGLAMVGFAPGLNGTSIALGAVSGKLNFAVNTFVSGNGINNTLLSGDYFLGNGYEITLARLSITSGSVIGGVFNASLNQGTSLTLDNVWVTNAADAYVVAGSAVEGVTQMALINGGVSLDVTGSLFEGRTRLVGGGYVDAGFLRITGGINISLTDSTGLMLFGGAWVLNGGLAMITGDININIDLGSGRMNQVFAGGFANGSVQIGGRVTTTITGGNFVSFVCNGVQLAGGNSSQGTSTLTITGGTFGNRVAAGGYSQGGVSVVNGDTYLFISGGTFNTTVYGGSTASSSANGNLTTVTGSTHILIDCRNNVITFNGKIIAGNAGVGFVHGDTNITFTGLGSNLVFNTSVSTVSGESEDTKMGINYVLGDRNIIFDNFTGDFNATIDAFSTLTIKGNSQVNYTRGPDSSRLIGIVEWNFDLTADNREDGVFICSATSNNFAGDAVNLNFDSALFDDDDRAVVWSGNSLSTVNGWESLGSVKFYLTDSQTTLSALWNDTLNGWSSGDWLFSLDSSDGKSNLVVSKLA